MIGCLLISVFMIAGCSKSKGNSNDSDGPKIQSKEKPEDKQAEKSAKTVQAEYDGNLEEIIGEGLIYVVLEGKHLEMTVASYHDVALEEIVIPDTVIYEEKEYTVTEIAESAFESNVLLREITLPEGMKAVGNSAFYACPELTKVVFSNTVDYIGESCFAECPELSQVELPDSLTSIGAEAFSDCSSLQEMTIPSKVKTMGRAVFYGCENLKECRFEEGITQVASEMFTNCYALAKVEIPDTVTVIGEEAFWTCESLTELALPENITMIGDRAFYSAGIKELRLPLGLSGVTVELLDGMDELEKIMVPESQKATYENLFQNYDLEILAY